MEEELNDLQKLEQDATTEIENIRCVEKMVEKRMMTSPDETIQSGSTQIVIVRRLVANTAVHGAALHCMHSLTWKFVSVCICSMLDLSWNKLEK